MSEDKKTLFIEGKEVELKPRETIQCPNCKRIFDMIKVMNNPINEGGIKWINSQSKETKEK